MNILVFIVIAILASCEKVNDDLQTPEELLERIKYEQVVPWGIELVGYQTSSSDSSVRVAILDSGIYKEHEDLKGKIEKEFNAINPGQPVKDDYGHGTALAGIITANDNDVGIVGVTQNVELYDVKVLNAEGKGSIQSLISAIKWCMEEQVDLINISFGFQSENKELERVIEQAMSQGILIVAAAGNTYGLGVDYPAQYTNVVSVNSIDIELNRPTSAAKGKIDIVAPGVDIISTDNEGGYSLYTGTSFATAYVTGILANIDNIKDSGVNTREVILYNGFEIVNLEYMEEVEYGIGLLKLN
ncbi:S8 family serine peptidase [Halalkalibacter sp. APA_J-10(15)]|uniref:S8 family serine peptidase n=1 Tax=Halalkalibacter sp. APA_J-10(15) TaxID=2933805 RepID=UPI001FF1114F|nr:S8 family serine peptidase [Halalkalibacter sp. APA_J-10(15)]MCK0470385.1 S8 family serine peptidase [Halalkalibacter sp. APA_J-10(15)]